VQACEGSLGLFFVLEITSLRAGSAGASTGMFGIKTTVIVY